MMAETTAADAATAAMMEEEMTMMEDGKEEARYLFLPCRAHQPM